MRSSRLCLEAVNGDGRMMLCCDNTVAAGSITLGRFMGLVVNKILPLSLEPRFMDILRSLLLEEQSLVLLSAAASESACSGVLFSF